MIFICLPIYLCIYLSICISVYPSRLPSRLHACTTGWFLCPWVSSQHLKACHHAMSFGIICHHVGFFGATPRGPASVVCPSANRALWSVGGGDSPCLGLGHVLTPELLVVKAPPKPHDLRVGMDKGALCHRKRGNGGWPYTTTGWTL